MNRVGASPKTFTLKLQAAINIRKGGVEEARQQDTDLSRLNARLFMRGSDDDNCQGFAFFTSAFKTCINLNCIKAQNIKTN